MRTYGLIFLLLLFSAPVAAEKLNAVHLVDGVFFESIASHGVALVKLRGPDGFISSMRFGEGQSVHIDALNVDGASLSDGFYRYEITLSPVGKAGLQRSSGKKVKIDRNAFSGMTDPKASPISGSFRIVNGEVLDPNLAE